MTWPEIEGLYTNDFRSSMSILGEVGRTERYPPHLLPAHCSDRLALLHLQPPDHAPGQANHLPRCRDFRSARSWELSKHLQLLSLAPQSEAIAEATVPPESSSSPDLCASLIWCGGTCASPIRHVRSFVHYVLRSFARSFVRPFFP